MKGNIFDSFALLVVLSPRRPFVVFRVVLDCRNFHVYHANPIPIDLVFPDGGRKDNEPSFHFSCKYSDLFIFASPPFTMVNL